MNLALNILSTTTREIDIARTLLLKTVVPITTWAAIGMLELAGDAIIAFYCSIGQGQ